MMILAIKASSNCIFFRIFNHHNVQIVHNFVSFLKNNNSFRILIELSLSKNLLKKK